MTAQNSNFDMRRAMLSHLTLAGTAALAGSAANAQIIVTSVNQTIGFAPGDLTSFTSTLPGVNQFHLNLTTATSIRLAGAYGTVPGRNFLREIRFNGIGNMQARAYGFSRAGKFHSFGLCAAPAGGTFSNVKWHSFWRGNANRANALIQGVSATTNNGTNFQGSFGSGGEAGGFNQFFTDKYLAFKFKDTTTGKTDYGWIEAAVTGSGYFSYPNYPALSLDIVAYAYDASGAKIQMGQTSVPEPSPVVAFAAFSALTLGAAGVRRLKALQS